MGRPPGSLNKSTLAKKGVTIPGDAPPPTQGLVPPGIADAMRALEDEERANAPAPPEPAGMARPPMRPADVHADQLRDDDPRARAERRTAELLAQMGGNFDLEGSVDEFYIDLREIPDGWSYEWKRETVYNAEDPSYTAELKRHGWAPVPTSRHPEMMAAGTRGSDPIRRKGLMLMERPQAITDMVRDMERRKARNEIKGREQGLAETPTGTLPRDADKRTAPRVKHEYAPVEIPQE